MPGSTRQPDFCTNAPESAACRQLLADGARRLDSRLEAEILLASVLGVQRSWLYAHADHPVAGEARRRYRELLQRRLAGEPVAYLTGGREFYSRWFQVTPDVLIPRPETELVVEIASTLPLRSTARVLDIGTGSGCIALTLAAEHRGWQVTATDLSPAALAVARTNRQALGLEEVELLHGDLFEPVAGRRFELVVSNPPYVADGDGHLERGDLRFEPHGALAAGRHGLAVIERLVEQAPGVLDRHGWLVLEHGHDQAGTVRAMLEDAGLVAVQSRRDLAGIERVTLGRRP